MKRAFLIVLLSYTLLPCFAQSASVAYTNSSTDYRICFEPAGYRIYSVGGKYLVGVPVAWNTNGAPTKYAYTLSLAQLQNYFNIH